MTAIDHTNEDPAWDVVHHNTESPAITTCRSLEAEVKPALKALQKTPPAQVLMGRFRTSKRRLPPGSNRWIGFDVTWAPASGP